jgi:hypothetical protein
MFNELWQKKYGYQAYAKKEFAYAQPVGLSVFAEDLEDVYPIWVGTLRK